MNPTQKPGAPGVEYPRGEIEILPPGQTRATAAGRPPFEFDDTSAARVFAFRSSGGGGLVTMIVAGVFAVALFAFLASALAIVATVAAIVVAGFYLRRWLGR